MVQVGGMRKGRRTTSASLSVVAWHDSPSQNTRTSRHNNNNHLWTSSSSSTSLPSSASIQQSQSCTPPLLRRRSSRLLQQPRRPPPPPSPRSSPLLPLRLLHRRRRTVPSQSSSPSRSPLSAFSPLRSVVIMSPPTGLQQRTSTQLPGRPPLLFDDASPILPSSSVLHGRGRLQKSPLISTSTPTPDDDDDAEQRNNSMDDSATNAMLAAIPDEDLMPPESRADAIKTPLRRCSTFDVTPKMPPKKFPRSCSFRHKSNGERDSFWEDDELLSDPDFLRSIDAI